MYSYRFHYRNILATVAIIGLCIAAGCTQLAGRPGSSVSAPIRNAKQSIINPTLVEPTVPANALGQGWYVDRFTNSASRLINFGGKISLSDLQVLRADPAMIMVLEVSAMPALTDLGLIAHLAAIRVRGDQTLLPVMRTLENDGHALARAVKLAPNDDQWITDNLRSKRIGLNGLGGAAAHGDVRARQELQQLAAQLEQKSIVAALRTALRSLVLAQHVTRLQEDKNVEANDAHNILRRFSFGDALDYLADAQMFRQLPNDYFWWQFGGPPIMSRPALSTRLGCFPLTSDTWEPIEKSRYDEECIPGLKPKTAWEQICASDDSRKRMDALLAIASATPNVVNAVRDLKERFKVSFTMPLKVASAKPFQWNDRQNFVVCAVILESSVSPAGTTYDRTQAPYGNPILAQLAESHFRSEQGSNGGRTLRLLKVLNPILIDPDAELPPVEGQSPQNILSAAPQPTPSNAPSQKSDPKVAPAVDTAVDGVFIPWAARKWAFDRYVPRSAHANKFDCNAGVCEASGSFFFTRGSSQISAQFKAVLEQRPAGQVAVTNLCYFDPSSRTSDCTP